MRTDSKEARSFNMMIISTIHYIFYSYLSMIVSSCQIIVLYSFLRLICRFYIIFSSLCSMFDILSLLLVRLDSLFHSLLPPFAQWLILVFFFFFISIQCFIHSFLFPSFVFFLLLPLPFVRWLIFVVIVFFFFSVSIHSLLPAFDYW